ncbi:hypothetical protein AB0425_17270 [Actinosynnema sp. NPDC051121]
MGRPDLIPSGAGGSLRTEYAVQWRWPDGSTSIAEFGWRAEDRRRAEYALASHPERVGSELLRREVRITGWTPVHVEQPGRRRIRTRRRR